MRDKISRTFDKFTSNSSGASQSVPASSIEISTNATRHNE